MTPYTQEDEPEPPRLRQLRRMVMVLMVVLMVGILAIAATIVIRLGFGGVGGRVTAGPVSAERVVLPEAAQVLATGQGPGTVHFLVRDGDGTWLLVFDAASGDALSRTQVVRNEGG